MSFVTCGCGYFHSILELTQQCKRVRGKATPMIGVTELRVERYLFISRKLLTKGGLQPSGRCLARLQIMRVDAVQKNNPRSWASGR